MRNYFKDLNKFELILWVVSVVVVILSFAFSQSGDYLTLIASLVGVTALIFLAKGYVIGQVLIIVFSIFYGVISFFCRYYGEMITYVFMTAPIALMALISWIKHPFKETKEVEVKRICKKDVAVMCVLAIIVTTVFYFILDFFNTANIFFSTISVTTSFLACYLTYLRSPFYALGYAANDVVLIILWVLASLKDISYVPMIFCFVMFFVNDMYGFFNWRKMEKRQKAT